MGLLSLNISSKKVLSKKIIILLRKLKKNFYFFSKWKKKKKLLRQQNLRIRSLKLKKKKVFKSKKKQLRFKGKGRFKNKFKVDKKFYQVKPFFLTLILNSAYFYSKFYFIPERVQWILPPKNTVLKKGFEKRLIYISSLKYDLAVHYALTTPHNLGYEIKFINNWIIKFLFIESFFENSLKKKCIFLINKLVITFKLNKVRRNYFFTISDGYDKNVLTHNSPSKYNKKNKRSYNWFLQTRNNVVKDFMENVIKDFLKNKDFKYVILIHNMYLSEDNFIPFLKITRKLSLKVIALQLSQRRIHNGLRLPKRRRK